MSQINVGIIGASGYTASELIRIINSHSKINIKYLVGNNKAGKILQDVFSHLQFTKLPKINHLEEINFSEIELIFLCLPHGESAKIINKIPDNIKIIDLSSDFRIKNKELYQNFYDSKKNTEYDEDTIYGLSEIYKQEIKKHRIIACPGCYPTSILLPLIPLIRQNLIKKEEIIIDSKTGISGAGRKITEANLFCEINENSYPYNINKHRHLAELIEQLDLKIDNIQFTPQIIPVSRGIISNIYVESTLSSSELNEFLTKFYINDRFIHCSDKKRPKLRDINGTNFCQISVFDTNINNKKLIITALDNLTKGSSGQAIQNFNLIYGFDEDLGLTNLATYP
jgi:N-acetyl-gamma-glutamyl-phosphate reductase